MCDIENANLVLRTYDLPLIANANQYGFKNPFKTSFTWKNINLRTLLGPMYDKYDTFNLSLVTIVSAVCDTAANLGVGGNAVSSDTLVNVINISGLPFLNNTYSVILGHNSGPCLAGYMKFTTNLPTLENNYSSSFNTFGKNQELCDITISYTRVVDGADPSNTLGGALPEVIFFFNIIGIPKTEHNNGTRIKFSF
jgi:hypothetical protein